jgi:hypothetical protein
LIESEYDLFLWVNPRTGNVYSAIEMIDLEVLIRPSQTQIKMGLKPKSAIGNEEPFWTLQGRTTWYGVSGTHFNDRHDVHLLKHPY